MGQKFTDGRKGTKMLYWKVRKYDLAHTLNVFRKSSFTLINMSKDSHNQDYMKQKSGFATNFKVFKRVRKIRERSGMLKTTP